MRSKMAEPQMDSMSTAEKGESDFSLKTSPSDTASGSIPPESPIQSRSSESSGSRLCRISLPIQPVYATKIAPVPPRELVKHARLTFSGLLRRFTPITPKLPADRVPVVRPVHGGPRGYPELGSFLNSDENFMQFRRFGYLQSRILLDKQERLRLLERELDELDLEQTRSADEEDDLCTLHLDDEEKAKKRDDLMERVETAFANYANLLQSAQSMVAMSKPSSSEYASVEHYIENEKPLVQKEASFVYRKEDLITLRPGREYAWLDSGIEKLLHKLHCSLVEWIFSSEETKKKSNQENEIYYTRSRIEAAANVIITLMILVLLIVPIYPLYHLTQGVQTAHTNAVCIGVLLVFTLAFAAVISLFTRARRHEILGASAAYCAVLVVFLGNVGGNANGSLLHVN